MDVPSSPYVLDNAFEPRVLKVLGFDIPIVVSGQVHDTGLGICVCQIGQPIKRHRVKFYITITEVSARRRQARKGFYNKYVLESAFF